MTFSSEYTYEWYRQHTLPPLVTAAKSVGHALAQTLHPETVMDVGCAVGAILTGIAEEMERCDLPFRGIGVDHPQAYEIVVFRGLWLPGPFVPLWTQDFEVPMSAPDHRPFRVDLAVSTEVGEHLTPFAGECLVGFLTSVSDVVAWSAAIPGQGGENHINERPLEYWEDLFRRRGYLVDDFYTGEVQKRAAPHLGGAEWYSRLRIFVRENAR